MILSFKTECYPTEKQKELIELFFRIRSFFFNKAVMTLKHRHGFDLKSNASNITKKEIMELRKDVFRTKYSSITKMAPSHILDTTMEDVLRAVTDLKKKPRCKDIKLRKKNGNSCRWVTSSPTGSFRYTNLSKLIQIPKLKKLKMAEALRWELEEDKDIRTVTIKKAAKRFFIIVTVRLPDNPPDISQHRHLGIDWGIKTYVTGYDGENIIEADFEKDKLDKLDKRIAKCQRSLSRKERFSNNWYKALYKLQDSYLRFNNYRYDFISKLGCELNQEYDSVTLENLKMRFVTSNKRLAKKAAQKPYYLLKVGLINKFSQFNKPVYLVPSNFPSTQKCCGCGTVKTGDEKMKLGQSIYVCNSCNLEIDRDHNAAINLYAYKNLELAKLDD